MRFVVLGASAAGCSAIKELRRLNPDAEIVLVSTDTDIYSRCILHHYLGDMRTIPQLSFVEDDFIDRYDVKWLKGLSAKSLNREEKYIILTDDHKVQYDYLMIGTGASIFVPPVDGLAGAKNAIGFRNLLDIERIKERMENSLNVVVLGGGLVGVDALTGLLEKGKKPHLVEMADRLLNRQLDVYTAGVYQKAYEEKGVTFHFGIGVSGVVQNDANEIVEVVLQDGSKLPCDLLLLTAGVRANVAFLNESGVECDKFGLLIDETGKTNDPYIYGAGDVTGRSPIWPAAVKQGIIAASNMSGHKQLMDDFFSSKATMNFLGIPTMSLGMSEPTDDSYIVEIENDDNGNYKKIIHKDGVITGALLQGDLAYAGVLTQLIKRNIDVSRVKKPLFEIDYSDFFNEDEEYEFYYEGEK